MAPLSAWTRSPVMVQPIWVPERMSSPRVVCASLARTVILAFSMVKSAVAVASP